MLLLCGSIWKKNNKEDISQNDEELKKDIPDNLFSLLDLVRKQSISDFDLNFLESHCWNLVNQILTNFNYIFRFSEFCKTFRYLIFSNRRKRKIVTNVLSCIIVILNDYEVVRHKSNRKMRRIFNPIDVIFEPVRHQKHKTFFFFFYKTLVYKTSYSDHDKISSGNCYDCCHCSKFYIQKERYKRQVKNCSIIPGTTYLFEKENLLIFEDN